MNSKDNSRNTNNTTENTDKNVTTSQSKTQTDSQSSMGNATNYISGDSTPSSSSHQFPRIATDPRNESKKSAQKTNS